MIQIISHTNLITLINPNLSHKLTIQTWYNQIIYHKAVIIFNYYLKYQINHQRNQIVLNLAKYNLINLNLVAIKTY